MCPGRGSGWVLSFSCKIIDYNDGKIIIQASDTPSDDTITIELVLAYWPFWGKGAYVGSKYHPPTRILSQEKPRRK